MDEPGCSVAYFRYTSEVFLLAAFVWWLSQRALWVTQSGLTVRDPVQPKGEDWSGSSTPDWESHFFIQFV